MIIQKLHIKGFRNFKDTWFEFADKSLIIGKNDVGKSNMLYALRILFDKKLSTSDLELTDSDFNVYDDSGLIEISAYLADVVEDCLVSDNCFKGNISRENTSIIRYVNDNTEDGYKFYVGKNDEEMEEIGERKYIKRLFMHYVDSQRDLFSFYKSEKKKLLESSMNHLSEEELEDDKKNKGLLKEDLESLNNKINQLNYISGALLGVNNVLKSISSTYANSEVRFTSVEQDVDKMLEKVNLTSFTTTGDVAMGGDGRNNQIYLATWLTQRKLEKDESSVVLFAIEEPESHLHAHQQRILADYFMGFNQGQLFLTTHSPQIVSRTNPQYIIKLTEKDNNVIATSGNTSDIIDAFDSFNYRLNPVSSELFYCDGAFLVEGESEVIFYRALSDANCMNLDSFNYSIINVGGIGFKPYIKLCKLLNIPFVVKTDNDIFAYRDGKNRFIGLARAIGIVKEMQDDFSKLDVVSMYEDGKDKLQWGLDEKCPDDSVKLAKEIRQKLESFNIYLSDIDLENDIANSEIESDLAKFYETETKEDLVKAMQNRKAENMFAFLNSIDTNVVLPKIKTDCILKPINCLANIVLKNKIDKDE